MYSITKKMKKTGLLALAILMGAGTAQQAWSMKEFEEATKQLGKAIEKNDLESAKTAITNDANIHEYMNKACSYKNLEIVKLLVEKGASVVETDAMKILKKSVDEACEKYKGDNDFFGKALRFLIQRASNLGDDGDTPLMKACDGASSLELVKFLVEKGANVNAKNKSGRTALIEACREKSNFGIIEFLIEKGADVKAKDRYGETALLAASEKSSLKTIKLLVEKGGDVNVKNTFYGDMPLHRAAYHGNLDAVQLLIEKGADKNAQSSNKDTALHLACKGGHITVVRFLVTQGADVTIRNRSGKTPLQVVSEESENRQEIIDYLTKIPVDSKQQAAIKKLFDAIKADKLQEVVGMINDGINVNARGDLGWTALHVACATGRLEIADLLITKGAKTNEKMDEGGTPLHVACLAGHTKIIKLLVNKNSNVGFAAKLDINAICDKSGWTPLHYACANCDVEAVEFLVNNGAVLHLEDAFGNPPSAYCFENGNADVIKFMESKGFKPKYKSLLKNFDEKATADLLKAAKEGDLAGCKDAIKRNASVNGSYDYFKCAPLYWACNKGHKEIAKYLVEEAGADTKNGRDSFGNEILLVENGRVLVLIGHE